MNISDTQSRVCYGYSRNALGRFVKNGNAPIVKKIFSLYLNGYSLRSIVNWLGVNLGNLVVCGMECLFVGIQVLSIV